MKQFCIYTILVILFGSFKAFPTDASSMKKKKIQSPSAVFLNQQLKNNGIIKNEKDENKLDKEFVSGLISLIVGAVGYYTTSSDTLKLAYSGVQSIGIVSIGSSIKKQYYPSLDQLYLDVYKHQKSDQGEMSDVFLKNYGLRDRAVRMSRLYTSGLLALQYASNAMIDNPSSQIKKIYEFLFGVNVLVFSYSYFFPSKYEAKSMELQLLTKEINNDVVPGLMFSYSF